MPILRSVRVRLTCWYSAILAGVLVVFGISLYGAVRRQSLHHHDDSLQAAARSVLAILERQPDCALLTTDQVADLGRVNRLLLVHDLAGQGQVFYRSPTLHPALLPLSETRFRDLLSKKESYDTLEERDGPLRVYSVRYTTRTGRQGVVRVVDSLGNVRESLSTLRFALIVMVPVSLLVAGVGGYWLAGRALRPVDQVTRLAREIQATNLSQRLPVPQTDDELGRLVRTFNQMIDRLEAGFESMRRFTADASHELRTPLAIMRGAIDVTLARERTVEEYRRALEGLLEEVERMARIVEDLLLLARADSGGLDLAREAIRLDELVTEVVEAMRPMAESTGIHLSVGRRELLEVAGDEQWLRQMLYNLVDNAIRYTGMGGRVLVSLGEQDSAALVSVSDTGSGIPEQERPRLFERFYRSASARGGEAAGAGAGLGLSIALWIARAHGGDIQVESRVGEGSTFRVSLPLDRRARPESMNGSRSMA